ncbi:MAG TPA: RodZ domain-containing protein, partial [Ramlibacter sp.]
MSEVAVAPLEEQQQQQEQPVSAGTLLRRAREAAGMHVAAVAVALKVPVRKLEALEAGRLEELGDAVFVRGLASSVCRTLKVDPQPVLERLPQTAAPRLVRDTDGLNAPFRAPGDGVPPTWIDRVRQPVPAVVIALVAAAVIVYFLPATLREEKVESTPVVAATAPAPAPTPAVIETVSPAPAETAGAGPATVPIAKAEPAAAKAEPAAAKPEPAPAVQASVAAPATGIVVVHAKGESWVEVVDAKGVVALRKLMQAGESAGADGALPLTVTIGRADMTDVEVR